MRKRDHRGKRRQLHWYETMAESDVVAAFFIGISTVFGILVSIEYYLIH